MCEHNDCPYKAGEFCYSPEICLRDPPAGNEALHQQLKLMQAHAKAALDKLPERWNAGFQAGLRQAIPYEKELIEALAAERQARKDDNAGFTEDIMKLEAENAELRRQLASIKGERHDPASH